MIAVTRITGESFNLQTGAHVPQGIVLSNGQKELHIPVGSEVVAQVLHLFAEDVVAAEEDGAHLPPPRPPPIATVDGNGGDPVVDVGPDSFPGEDFSSEEFVDEFGNESI